MVIEARLPQCLSKSTEEYSLQMDAYQHTVCSMFLERNKDKMLLEYKVSEDQSILITILYLTYLKYLSITIQHQIICT